MSRTIRGEAESVKRSKKMKKTIVCFFWTIIFASILLKPNVVICAEPVEQIPAAKFTLPAPDSAQAQEYLGLRAAQPFEVSDIKAKLVVIEFMSALCPHCLTNAPMVNSIYKTIRGDSRLDGVKIIAIAIANEKAEVEAYKKVFKVPFPVIRDEDSAISTVMDLEITPTTMIVSPENGKVLSIHTGVIEDPERFVKQLKELYKKK